MGFIKLPDNLDEWAWYGDNTALLVYIRLRVAAKYKAADVGNVHLERGQVATSIREIAETNGVSIRQARTALERLKPTNKITVKLTSKISIVTLIDYDCNCDDNSQSDTPSLLITDNRLTKRQTAENTRTRETPEKAVENSSKPKKLKFAEFVSMTNEEYSSLVTELGEQGAKRCIEILDNYKGQSGKIYKSDYRAIKNWVITRYNEEQAKHKQPTAESRPAGAFNTGNPFLDMLRDLEEQEAKEIVVQGNIADNDDT